MSNLFPSHIANRIAREFPLLRKTAHLNAASVGAWPLSSRRELEKHLSEWDDFIDPTVKALHYWDETKKELAKMIKAHPDEIGFAFNTSHGLNIAAAGIDFRPGDEIILSDIEFPANTYPWTKLKAKGVKIKFIKSHQNCFDTDNFLKAITARTKLFSISFVQFFNGYANDLEELGKVCEQYGIFFAVDGIQGVGAVPVDVRKCRIDLLSCGAQKWLCSPVGCGFFYLSSKAKFEVAPIFSGWFAIDWKADWNYLIKRNNLKPVNSAERFAMSAFPYMQMYAMQASVKLIGSIGVAKIHKHNLALIDRLVEYLDGHTFYHLASSLAPKHRSSIISFTCPDMDKLGTYLKKKNVIISVREGLVRVSVHFYNTTRHINTLIASLDEYCSNHGKSR